MSEIKAKEVADAMRRSQGTVIPATHVALMRDGEIVRLYAPDEFEKDFADVKLEKL